ncbi:unnamed protein product [Penicillium roqueforti FM164]|uniref:Genomic scaffold, ProqFM164S03 n=1 Tax=Penicillium roqueforti (strain FM164) TaxID=1365484 RepID=W6QGK6_PENRF|nr:unnamed protein product [Penicillium roqueforti FM164]
MTDAHVQSVSNTDALSPPQTLPRRD